jgi:diguanylate cyclase (GGDEF)-like protein
MTVTTKSLPLPEFLKHGWLFFVVSLVGVLAVLGIVAASSVTAPDKNISQGVLFFEDTKQNLNIQSIQALPDNAWQQEQGEFLSFGMSPHPHWLKFEIPALTPEHTWLLELDYALLDDISLWFIDSQGLLNTYQVGDKLKFAQRQYLHEKFLFEIPHGKQAITVILRVKTSGTLRVPLRLWKESSYLVFNGEHSIAMGLFFGFMAAMGLSNFFFFVTTRVSTFLVYSGYVLSLALTLAALHGLGYKYLWPNNPWLQEHGLAIYANATIFFVIIFTDLLLNIKAHSRLLSKIFKFFAGGFIFSLAISLLLPHELFIRPFLVVLSIVAILIFAVGIWLWIKGVRLARFYTMAWTALLLSAFITSFDNLGLLDVDIPSHYLLMIGATIETFLLALVLALGYSQQRQEMFDAQELALKTEREARKAQKEMFEMQNKAQEKLEYSVQERTLELEVALRELSETNRELEEKNTLDALTGIRNRSYFDKKYTAEIRRSRREHTELSIVMLDIDHFKKVNDQYGHLVGDECIKFVASTLQNALKRPSDDVCRYGGEEFALIMPSTDNEGALTLVENVRLQIEKHAIQSGDVSVNLTISAGISTAIADPQQPEEAILAFADKLLYLAKDGGRNQIKAAQFTPKTIETQE